MLPVVRGDDLGKPLAASLRRTPQMPGCCRCTGCSLPLSAWTTMDNKNSLLPAGNLRRDSCLSVRHTCQDELTGCFSLICTSPEKLSSSRRLFLEEVVPTHLRVLESLGRSMLEPEDLRDRTVPNTTFRCHVPHSSDSWKIKKRSDVELRSLK